MTMLTHGVYVWCLGACPRSYGARREAQGATDSGRPRPARCRPRRLPRHRILACLGASAPRPVGCRPLPHTRASHGSASGRERFPKGPRRRDQIRPTSKVRVRKKSPGLASDAGRRGCMGPRLRGIVVRIPEDVQEEHAAEASRQSGLKGRLELILKRLIGLDAKLLHGKIPSPP